MALRERVHVRLLLYVVLATISLANPIRGAAHARLEISSPVSGTALASMPTAIDLTFTEPIDSDMARFTLRDPSGNVIELIEQTVGADALSAHLVPADVKPAPGTFSLTWAVHSTSDGHDSSGTILFSVGTGRAPLGSTVTSDVRSSSWQILLRALWLVSLGSLMALSISRSRSERVLAGLAGMVGFVAALGSPAVARSLSDLTASGQMQLAAGLCTLAAGLLLLATERNGWDRKLAYVFWATAVALIAGSGHAAGLGRANLATVIAAVHSGLALIWFGAILRFSLDSRLSPALPNLARFSRIAVVGLIAIVGAGVGTAALHLPDQRSITESTYGKSLALKVGIVVLVLAIAATNRWVTLPWVSGDGPGLDRQSRWLLFTETSALLAAIILGAVLSNTAPPSPYGVVQVAAPISRVSESQQAPDLTVELSATITGTVDDRVLISVVGSDGAPITDLQRLIVASALTSADGIQSGERFDADALPDAPGSWTFSAVRLGISGIWTVETIVRRTGVPDVTSSFEIDTRAWSIPAPNIVQRGWTVPLVPPAAWALLALAVIVAIGGVIAVRRQQNVAPLSGGIIFLALAMIAAGFTIQAIQRSPPRTSGHELNVPTDPDLVSAAANYDILCLACHGADGAGLDTIDPNHQHGSGTNLIDGHSRVLADGDLFTIVSDGTIDTDMPSYALALSEQERWNMVAWLRELQSRNPDDEDNVETPTP